LLTQKKYNEAVVHLNEVLRISPYQTEVYAYLGEAYSQLGKYELSIQNWTKASELKPDNAEILNNLAWLYATVNDTSVQNTNKAIELAQHACELTGYNDPGFLDTLAVAYASAGKFGDAKATAKKALSIAKSSGREDLASEIEKRIKFYEAGQPYRQK
jgi:spermidine synthase